MEESQKTGNESVVENAGGTTVAVKHKYKAGEF